MSNKKLLEETTIRKFMKLANIEKPLRENFVSALDERGGFRDEDKGKRGPGKDYWSTRKTRRKAKKGKQQQDEAGYPADELDEHDMGLGEDDMDLGEEDMDLGELEIGGDEGPELDISEEDAMAFIRVAKALEQALGVEVEAELEDEEADLEDEEADLEDEEGELEDELEPEEVETDIDVEVEDEGDDEDIEVEEEDEEEVELQEALVKKVAARVAKRLLKKR